MPAKSTCKLPPCVACLYRVGWGIKRIVRFTGFSKTTVHRFSKLQGLTDTETAEAKMARANEIKAAAATGGKKEAARLAAQERIALRAMGPHLPKTQRYRRTAMARYYARSEVKKRADNVRAKAIQLKRYYAHRHEPQFKARQFARGQLGRIKRQAGGFAKAGRSIRYLGCTYQHAVNHITDQLPAGWTWANYGSAWEIDHIVQLSDGRLTDPVHIARVCHYTNLRPLAVATNRQRPRGAWAGRQRQGNAAIAA